MSVVRGLNGTISLNGTRFNREITKSDIASIASATNVDAVSSTWGRIVDWFCGTKKEEAKKELFGFIHNDLSHQKIDHFTKLKNMVSPAYKDNFTYEVSHREDGLFNFDFKIKDVLEIYNVNTTGKVEEVSEKVSLCLNEMVYEGSESLEQLKKDIVRCTYYCEGIKYRDGSLTAEKLEEFASSMSQEQRKSLDLIASQTGVIAVRKGIELIGDGRVFVGNPELLEISMSKDEAGVVQVELTMKQNHEKVKFEVYKQNVAPEAQYPCLSMNAIIKINPDGSHYFEFVKVSHPGV
ncbi:TPA: hypothetical protein O3H02_004282 [Salmonella enterica subsp. enterica serovar Saintpaul str. CFSAN004144]|nr:hypothetical protein [Salmonella enterica subsp. enterica serovar Saintpaul str. CFSAN004144]